MGVLYLMVILVIVAVAIVGIYITCPEWLPESISNFILGEMRFDFIPNTPDIKDDAKIGDDIWVVNNDGDKYDQMLDFDCQISRGGIRDDKLYIVIGGKKNELTLTSTDQECLFFQAGDKKIIFKCKKNGDGIKITTHLSGCTKGVKAFTPAELRTTPKRFSVYWLPVKKTELVCTVYFRPISKDTPLSYEFKTTSPAIGYHAYDVLLELL